MTKGKGLTLVDVLAIVLGIIAVLVLLFMGYVYACGSAMEEANRAVCAVNLRDLNTACNLYADDHLDKYPVGWRHTNDGAGGWTTGGEVTPEDSFALLIHKDLLKWGLICPSQGGDPAADEWELVGIGGAHDGDPGAAAEAYIHYAYQDVGVGDGKNYFAGKGLPEDWPVFADRGVLKEPASGDYELTGEASANHTMWRGCQNVACADGSVSKVRSKSEAKCMVGCINGTLGDNIYTDTEGENDTYLLSSKAQAGY